MEAGFLAEKEVHNIRPLWEEVFAEDSKAFTDYYFANKAERNLVMTRKEGEQIVSMLHLTPYMTGRMESVCYIVGVATKEAYRRQGLMADMMKEALQFMKAEGQPFTFLMPANPAYYTPFDFTYVYDKPMWKISESVLPFRYLDAAAKYSAEFHLVVKEKGSLQIKATTVADYQTVADFANEMLKQNADCYMLRNANYYRVLQKELIAQNGNLFMIKRDGALKGILAYVHEQDKPGVQEVILDEDLASWQLVTSEEYKPAIMARILRPEAMLQSLRCTGTVDLLVELSDPILTVNNGVYHLYSGEKGRLVCRKRNREVADCKIDIDDLTAFVFGYKRAADCFEISEACEGGEILEGLEQINVLKRVFINEIV